MPAFNTAKVLTDRYGTPVKEPALDAEGKTTTRTLTHGMLACKAIDMKADGIKSGEVTVDDIRTITVLGAKLVNPDTEWVMLKNEEVTLIQASLCRMVSRLGYELVGPVMVALDDAPNKIPEHPANSNEAAAA